MAPYSQRIRTVVVWDVCGLRKFLLLLSLASYSAFAGLNDCTEAFRKIFDAESHTVKNQHLNFKSPSNNQLFERIAREKSEGSLFFHVENAILKQMNDKILLDKELSASLQSLYAKIFFEELEGDSKIRSKAIYSDYKSIRIVFEKDSPDLRHRVSEVYRKSALRYQSEVKNLPGIQSLFAENSNRIAKNTAAWNLPGMGSTADEAALVSRSERFSPIIEVGVPTVNHVSDANLMQDLTEHVRTSEYSRARAAVMVEAEFGKHQTIFIEGTLSPEAIEILKKADSSSWENFQSQIQERFKIRFGNAPSAELILALQSYLHHADVFAPTIFEKKDEKDLGLAGAKNGIVTLDIIGQNVRNTGALLRALHKYSHGDLGKLLEGTRNAQDKESGHFARLRDAIHKAILSAKLPGKVSLSGDEIAFIPSRVLTEPEREQLFHTLHGVTHGGKIRMSYVPPHFQDSTTPVPPEFLAQSAANAEAYEKSLRLDLEKRGYTPKVLSNMTFSIEYQPSIHGPPKILVRKSS